MQEDGVTVVDGDSKYSTEKMPVSEGLRYVRQSKIEWKKQQQKQMNKKEVK